MKEGLPIKETVGISITSNPYHTGALTRWPTLEQLAQLETEASLEIPMELLNPKPQSESAERPSYRYGSNDGAASFGIFKEQK